MVEELGRRKVNHGVREWYICYHFHCIRLFDDLIVSLYSNLDDLWKIMEAKHR